MLEKLDGNVVGELDRKRGVRIDESRRDAVPGSSSRDPPWAKGWYHGTMSVLDGVNLSTSSKNLPNRRLVVRNICKFTQLIRSRHI